MADTKKSSGRSGQHLRGPGRAGGGVQPTPNDPDFAKTMQIADEVMDEYRHTLATLAK